MGARLTSAQVAAPNVVVDWSAPPQCPDRTAVLRIVRERLPKQGTAFELRARAEIVRRGDAFRLDLELVSPGAHANRSLTDSRCAPLAEAAAVLIALAIETGAATAERQAEPEPEPKPTTIAPPSSAGGSSAPAPVVEKPQTSTSRPQRLATTSPPNTNQKTNTPERAPAESTSANHGSQLSARNPLHLQLSASARAGLGTFPHQPALGVQAQVAARFRALYLALGLTYWPAREQSSPYYPGARLRGSGVFADLSVGLDVIRRPVVLTPGLNVELGQLSAEAVGIGGPELNRVPWLAAGPSGSIGVIVFNDWTVALELTGLVPIYRTHWLVRTPAGDVSAFVAARLSLRLSLRVSYAFP